MRVLGMYGICVAAPCRSMHVASPRVSLTRSEGKHRVKVVACFVEEQQAPQFSELLLFKPRSRSAAYDRRISMLFSYHRQHGEPLVQCFEAAGGSIRRSTSPSLAM